MSFEMERPVLLITGMLIEKYKFHLTPYVSKILAVQLTNPIGFDFVCNNPRDLRWDIMKTGAFAYDDKSEFFLALASAATDGYGYREIGKPSVHLEVSGSFCNIHIDSEGFMLRDADGNAVIGPNMGQHIVTDLILPPIKHKLHIPDAVDLRVPNTTDGYSLGVRVGNSSKYIILKASCGDLTCKDRTYFLGVGGELP